MFLRQECHQKLHKNLLYGPIPEELEEPDSPALAFEIILAFSNTMSEYESGWKSHYPKKHEKEKHNAFSQTSSLLTNSLNDISFTVLFETTVMHPP
jgi:hypothetical protein